jgi:hypothetical protein
MTSVVIITGYSKRVPEETAMTLKKVLINMGYSVYVIDPFQREREKFLFRKTLLTRSSTEKIVESVEESYNGPQEVNVAFFYSYGGIVGPLQKCFSARINVFLSPAIGKGTVRKTYLMKFLRFFPFFPALRDIDSEKFQEKLSQKIRQLKNLYFFLPRNMNNLLCDEKVSYSQEIISRLPYFESFIVKRHIDMIQNTEIVERILEDIQLLK